MPAQWTGEFVGKMHLNNVSKKSLAKQLNCSAEYVSMVLNGKRTPKGAEQKVRTALAEMIQKRADEQEGE